MHSVLPTCIAETFRAEITICLPYLLKVRQSSAGILELNMSSV